MTGYLFGQESKPPACDEAILNSAGESIGAGQVDAALETLRSAAPSCAGIGRFHAVLAAALLAKRLSVDAAREYYAAIALSPQESDYYRALAEILIQNHAFGNARVLLVKANREFPDQQWTYLMLGEVYRAHNSFNEAKSVVEEAVKRWPDNAAAHVLLGNILVGAADSDALAEYRKAIHLAPELPQAYLFYGIQLEKLNQTDEAIAAFTKCVALDPSMANAHYYLGHIHLKRGDFNACISELTTVLQLSPSYALAYFDMGTAYRKLGDKAKADVYLRRFGELSTEQKTDEAEEGRKFTEALAKPQQ